jgi:amino acid adenylation domain-containing protein
MVQDSKVYPGRGVDCYPLSPLQQGMLFHSLEGGSQGVDLEQVVGELREEINAAHFERAWRDVVARHAILRTSFHWSEGAAPRQVVHSPTAARLQFRYAEFGSAHEARRGVEEYLVTDRREGFRLESAPLLRVALLRGGPAHYWFVTTFHHLVLDGRAMVVMFREALELHDAYVAGTTLELPAPRPYRAYIDWLQQQDWTRAEKFWRAQLKGFSAPTTLAIARGSEEAGAATDARGELAFQTSEHLTTRLRAAARRHDVTMNTLLQGAWASVLSRYSGETDVVFGAVRACRHIPVDGAASMVGLLINTVPVRVQVDPDATIAEYLQGLREQWLALRDHEHTPLMQLQQWSDVAPGRPLFETLFNYQEPSWDAALRALGAGWARREFDIVSQPNYPLALDAYGSPTAVIVKILFDRRRFDDAAIARLLGHYRAMLESFASESTRTVGELELLTERERRQILVEWNRTTAEYPRNVCVPALVEACTRRDPERCAVADAATTLTYDVLNRRANRLARRLQALAVGPEVAVAVCMTRSVEMIVAWLAVAKAGGALVPLDPNYPKDRLTFQLGDCGAHVLLTQPHVRPALPEVPASVAVLELTSAGQDFADESEENLPPTARSGTLAYIIYTSGSTGQPKGVMVEHGALMNLVTWHQKTYAVTAADRATQLASPAFDASVWEIWPYLTAGASVHLPPDDVRVAPTELVRWLAVQRITLAFLPTPIAEAVLLEPWPERLALRAVLTGGDQLKRRPPANLPFALINHYGPTENTVVATCGLVEVEGAAGLPTIGRPIANTRAYILDGRLRPLPVGVPGELFLGGESLARGYLHRDTLTAEKFVADLFARRGEKSRLYRTGDLVRWRDDGAIEYLGRLDGQVKIRGCRIELGEIEATLRRHPAASDSLVLARPDARGQMQLVAYVRGTAATENAGRELHLFLRESLPAYMVPAAIVFVGAWPLTANGKIDRQALPAPVVVASASETSESNSGTERAVIKAWTEVLGRPAIQAADNFFEIGGHSLLAAQVITRLNGALGASLSVRHLFDQPTVAGLAREIDRQLQGTEAPRAPASRLKRRAARPELELVPPT